MSARMRQGQLAETHAALGELAEALLVARGEDDIAVAVTTHVRGWSASDGIRLESIDVVRGDRLLHEDSPRSESASHIVESGRDARWRVTLWGGKLPQGGLIESALRLGLIAAEREALRQELDQRDAAEARLDAACDTVGAPTDPPEAARRITAAARVLMEADGAAFLPAESAENLPGVWDGIGPDSGLPLPQCPETATRALTESSLWSGPIPQDHDLARHGFTAAAVATVGADNALLVAFRQQLPRPEELELLRSFTGRATVVLGVADGIAAARGLSAVDSNTSLYNAAYFRSRLAQETSRAMRTRSALSVLAVGIPTAPGSSASLPELRTIVSELRASLREMDVPCRLADDELAVILPELDGMGAFLVGERLRAVTTSDTDRPGVAVGIASFPDQAGSGGELARNAARALAWARHHGGDRTFLYDRDVALGLRVDEERQREQQGQTLTALHAIAAHLDGREGQSGSHSQNVGRVSGLLARQIGLPPSHAETVRTAGLLHDVGKLGVPQEVLSKRDPLTEAEWDEVRSHSSVGERMLSGTELGEVRAWIRHHHERMDGSGYPAGLRGDDIPMESRIIAVAEALDAMVHDSPYRPAMGPQEALDELRRCAGDQFDPQVVDALLELVARGVPGVIPG